jgi:Fic family protein
MLQARLEARLEAQKRALDKLRPLPSTAVARLREQLTIEWVYHSNAIEGNTLSLRETQLILQEGITIGGKSLREHFEVVNHRQAITLVEALAEQSEPITPFQVRQLHALVLSKIDEENAGQYRSLPVRIVGTTHEPPPAWAVPSAMESWAEWLASASNTLAPIPLAALAHHKFVAIHPFIDGNGRTGRLLLNLILLRAGYPPTIITHTSRRQYYRVLAQADKGNPVPLVNFVGQAVGQSLALYLEACTPQTAPPAVANIPIPLTEAVKLTPYTIAYLRHLARTGALEAYKKQGHWYTTPQAVQTYLNSVT